MKKILVFLIARTFLLLILLAILLGILSFYGSYYDVDSASSLTVGTIIFFGLALTNKDIRKELIDLLTKDQHKNIE